MERLCRTRPWHFSAAFQPAPKSATLSGAEFQTFCADSLLHEEKHPWLPLLKCKTGKLDRRNFIEEKQVGETLLQLGGQNQGEQPFITSIAYAFHHDARKWPLTYLVLKKKNPSLQSGHEKNIRQITTQESPVRDLTSSLQNCQGRQWQIWDMALGKRRQRKCDN